VIGGLVACIVALAFYPGLILHRADQSASASVAGASEAQPTQVAER
jgi:hypothetical protein